jgi:hypothetical protein
VGTGGVVVLIEPDEALVDDAARFRGKVVAAVI